MKEPNLQDREKILEQKTAVINIRISPKIKNQLVSLAAIHGLTLSEIVEIACTEHLQTNEEKRKIYVENDWYKKQHSEDQKKLDFFFEHPTIKFLQDKTKGKALDYVTRENYRKKAIINNHEDLYNVIFETINLKF